MPVDSNPVDRRTFLARGAQVGAAAGPLIATRVHAANDGVLKIGLIGCGGRGSGAALQALKADPKTKLIAMCDIFPDRLAKAYANLKRGGGNQVEIPEANRFSGFDGYQKLINLDLDVVLLACPPGFRPKHLAACAAKGVHVFCEKPVAVDVPGIHSVMNSARIFREKRKSLVSGLCWRYEAGIQETIKRIQDGAIGEIRAIEATTMSGNLWNRPITDEMSDVEKQLRNWNKWTWLCGDVYVESHIHSLDMAAWVMGDIPLADAWGMGGLQQPRSAAEGNIFDHHSVNARFTNNVVLTTYSRNQLGAMGHYDVHVIGSKGEAWTRSKRIVTKGGEDWRFRGRPKNMYQVEHDTLFAAIRADKPVDNSHYMINSNLMAILGRTASYTGQKITWEQLLKSEYKLGPKTDAFGPFQPPPVAVPGRTKFV
jgi:predicted dehydrogenase